jgi:hypothetical protein
MLDALLQHTLNLVFLAGISLIAIGLGRLILCRAGIRVISLGEYVVFSLGLGFGILSYSAFVLGALQLLYPAAVYLLVGLCAPLSLAGWFSFRCPSKMEGRPTFKTRLSFWDRCIGVILIACLLVGFLLVLTPDVGKDALIYHLAVPKLFLKHHGMYFIPGNIFAHYPLNSEMLYVVGLAVRGDVVAKGIHFVMALCILLGMWQFARHHISEIAFAPLALLVFYTIPSVFATSHMAYGDLTVSFYAFLTVYAFVNWFSRREQRWLILCGVLSGVAISTKYTALLLPFLACLGILWACLHHRASAQQALRLLLVYVTCTAVVGSPFYIKNWIMTGNPFYPFLYGIFDGRGLDPEQARLYDLFVHSLGMGRGLLDYLLLPWNVSINARMHSPQFDGVLGPVFILTLPFAVGMRNIAIGAKIAMAYCLFAFMFWASSAQQIRYLIPVFPFLAIMTAYVLSYYRRRRTVLGVLVVLIAGSLCFNGYHIVKDFLKIRPVGVITGLENREGFLSRMIPSYAMFQYVKRYLPEDSNIFLIYMKNFGYLCDRAYYSDSMFESYTIQKILARSSTPAEVYVSLKDRGFTHILYDSNYVSGDMSTFSEQEEALFLAFQKQYLELIRTEKERYYLYRLV